MTKQPNNQPNNPKGGPMSNKDEAPITVEAVWEDDPTPTAKEEPMAYMTPRQAVAELLANPHITAAAKRSVEDADRTVAQTVMGQNYGSVPTLEIRIANGKNITFVASEKTIAGMPFFSKILEQSNFNCGGFPTISIEKGQCFKAAQQSERGDDTPYTDQWERLCKRLSVEHGNPNFPFAVVATDNGFTLIPKPLASLFVQFAGKHIEVVEYLKVLCQLSIGITPVRTLISEDLYFQAPENKEVQISPTQTVKYEAGKIYPNGTDGMSMIKQSILSDLNISEHDGIQFRAISAETVRAMREHDWTEFNHAWENYFKKAADNAIKALLTESVDWSSFGPSFDEPCILKRLQPQEFSIKIAKLRMNELLGKEEAKRLRKSLMEEAPEGTSYWSIMKRWWDKNIALVFEDIELNNSLFSKGAATPVVNIGRQVRHITKYETGQVENLGDQIDMVTPRKNFKCYGKKELEKIAQEYAEEGKVLIVEQFVAIINPVSGGSMVTTPHCFEAGGTGVFEDMSPDSVSGYKEQVDIYRADIIDFVEGVNISATTKKAKSNFLDILCPGGYPEPIDIQALRAHINANIWLDEKKEEKDYPGNPLDLVATARGNENLFRGTSREMSSYMMQGDKKATNRFKLLHMCGFVAYDEVGAPGYLKGSYESTAKAEKQPIQSTSNTRMVKVLFAVKDSWYSMCLASMGYDPRVNIYCGSEANCVLDWFADDDGDVLNLTLIPKASDNPKKALGRFNGIISVILSNVKMERLQRCAGELPTMPLCDAKAHDWMDTTIPGTSPLDKFGKSIGLFVNQSSLSNNAGHLFCLPVVNINDNGEFSITFNVYCTTEGQCELDAKKKDKASVPFMVCHTQKVWNEVDQLWEIPENVLNHLVPWCMDIRNGVHWETFTHTCGKVVVNPSCFDIKEENGITTYHYMGEQWSHEMFTENLLWCNRDVLEKFFGGTPEYVKWFESLIIEAGYSKHNYVTHYKSGYRFVTEDSLRNRKTKSKKGFITSVSPLAPVTGKHAGLFAGPNRLTGRSGFGVNIATGNKGGPDYRYLGDTTLVSISHKIWLKAFWMKWQSLTGISPVWARNYVEKCIAGNYHVPEYYDVVTGRTPEARPVLLRHVFGEELSSFQIFKKIIGNFVGEDGLETLKKSEVVNIIAGRKGKFQWLKPSGAFGSEAMVELALGLAKHTITKGGKPVDPKLIESLIEENIAKGVFSNLKKDIWTCFLDYCLLPIMDRWTSHTLPCEFAKALSEINWSDLENNPAAAQGITLKVDSLHMKVTNQAFSECKCCRPILIQGLKSLGRKEDKVKLERFKSAMATYLTETQFAFGKNIVQFANGKSEMGELHEAIAGCVNDGSWLSIEQFDRVGAFFGDFFTKGDEIIENSYSPTGYKFDRKSSSWGDGENVEDLSGRKAKDLKSWEWTSASTFAIGGYIMVGSTNLKEVATEFFQARKKREEFANSEGLSKIHLVWLDPRPVTLRTVEITTIESQIDGDNEEVIAEDLEDIYNDMYENHCGDLHDEDGPTDEELMEAYLSLE